MHLLGSASLRVQKNVAAKSLCASESRWAVGFENGTVNVLDNQGILQFKVKSPTDRSESNFGEKLPLNAIAIADSRRLLISWGRDEFLHGYDLMNGEALSSSELTDWTDDYGVQPTDMIVLPSYPQHVLCVETISRVLIQSITSDPRQCYCFEAPILDYGLFKHHAAYSLLALLCQDGIVHVLSVPNGSPSPQPQSVCTISVHPQPVWFREDGPYSTPAEQMHSILILSATRVLTGHGDGKIRLWDVSRLPTTLGKKVAHLGAPTCAMQAHRGSECAVNGLLVLSSTARPKDSPVSIVSTGTDGFVKCWLFSPTSGSNNQDVDKLELVYEVRLFAGAILSSTLGKNDKWFFAAGDEAGGSRTKAWNFHKGEKGKVRVWEVGNSCRKIWHVHCTRENRLFVSLMKEDGKAYGEAWDVSDIKS